MGTFLIIKIREEEYQDRIIETIAVFPTPKNKSLSHTMPPFQSIFSLTQLMKFKLLIMKLFMISASELLNLPPQPMEILTILFQLLCQELPAHSDSQVNLMLISEN